MPTAKKVRQQATPFCVVGIGASAGGIQALQSLFNAIPAGCNLAFVVVQHLVPDRPSKLAALLARWASLPVREAADGVKLERECVFVAAPHQALVLQDGVFATRARDRVGPRAGIDTIDSFFESLAADCGARAIGVVLSGTGSDGAAGAVRIKQAGGRVLVQEPATAMHNSMPLAAIANGAADHVLPLGVLAQELTACASPDYVRPRSAALWADEVTKALDGIIQMIRTRAGFDLTGYKTTPLLWRIQRRMQLRGVPFFLDYEALLQDDPAEIENLVRGIPIHVTEFFRDAPAWQQIDRVVIPRLFDEAGEAPIRAWTPACATGEEAYSLAMLLAERAEALAKPLDFQVLATDTVPGIVALASRGIFKAQALSTLSPERRQRFFYAADGAFRVKRALRAKMVFAPQDLLADPPFTGLDLITCRNLLIYLEPQAVRYVIYLLHSALRVGGYLLLGTSEALPPKQLGFEEVTPGERLYRKVGPAAKVELEFPKRPPRLRASRSSQSTVEAHAREMVAESNELPAALIDETFQIIRLYGDTAPFFRLKAGEPTLNLMKVAGRALRASIQRAAQEARDSQTAVTIGSLPDPDTGELTLTVRVSPLDTPEEAGSRLLVSFIRGGRGETLADPALRERPRAGETTQWSEALRVSHEELEASREELQALNEELRASNDQLNLANDDLAASNAQLQSKIEELQLQSNVLSSGVVTTLFLDPELRIRWFTPAISAAFPLAPADTGRRITDFVQRFEDENFIPDVLSVMEKNEPRESEVRNRDGSWFLRRIRPYLDGTQTAAGVAVNFTDITQLKQVERALSDSESLLALELADTQQLHRVSSSLIKEQDIHALYGEILEAARALMRSSMASIQELIPDRDVLSLLAAQGFAPESAEYWQQVDAAHSSSCGVALARREPVVVPDVEDWQLVAGTEDLRHYRLNGIRALLSMPLISRDGHLVGVMSTHWRHLHQPSEREVRLLDVLARQVADLIERTRVQEAAAEEFRNTKILRDLSAQLVKEGSIQSIYDAILTAALEMTRAVAGSVQILDPETEELVILATRGFSRATREYFHRIDASSNTSCGLALRTGERAYFDFDPASADVSVRRHVDDGVLSAQSSPLVSRSGKPIGMVSTHWSDAGHRPSERELRFLDLLARQAADLIEQRRAERALGVSEEKYRVLFESIDEGFCIVEVLFDEHDRAIDYAFVEANPSFARHAGFEVTLGRRMREIAPEHETHWFDIYSRVALTGEPARFEHRSAALGTLFDGYAFRVGEPKRRWIAVLFRPGQ